MAKIEIPMSNAFTSPNEVLGEGNLDKGTNQLSDMNTKLPFDFKDKVPKFILDAVVFNTITGNVVYNNIDKLINNIEYVQYKGFFEREFLVLANSICYPRKELHNNVGFNCSMSLALKGLQRKFVDNKITPIQLTRLILLLRDKVDNTFLCHQSVLDKLVSSSSRTVGLLLTACTNLEIPSFKYSPEYVRASITNSRLTEEQIDECIRSVAAEFITKATAKNATENDIRLSISNALKDPKITNIVMEGIYENPNVNDTHYRAYCSLLMRTKDTELLRKACEYRFLSRALHSLTVGELLPLLTRLDKLLDLRECATTQPFNILLTNLSLKELTLLVKVCPQIITNITNKQTCLQLIATALNTVAVFDDDRFASFMCDEYFNELMMQACSSAFKYSEESKQVIDESMYYALTGSEELYKQYLNKVPVEISVLDRFCNAYHSVKNHFASMHDNSGPSPYLSDQGYANYLNSVYSSKAKRQVPVLNYSIFDATGQPSNLTEDTDIMLQCDLYY